MNKRRRYKPQRQYHTIDLSNEEKVRIETLNDNVRFSRLFNGAKIDEVNIKRQDLLIIINGICKYLVETNSQNNG